MSLMIPVHLIGGKQFMKARTLMSPVILNPGTFLMPSADGDGDGHLVRFDDAESPTMYSCTCKAGSNGTPCWGAARALDALTYLSIGNLYVARRPPDPDRAAAAVGPLRPPLRAAIDERGEMALLTVSATPLAGYILDLP